MNCHHRAARRAQKDGYKATGGPDALQISAMDNPVIFDRLLSVYPYGRSPIRAPDQALGSAESAASPGG